MDAITKTQEFINRHPAAADAQVLAGLLRALQEGEPFDVERLYELNLSCFELAVEVLNAWRLQRYYRGDVVVVTAGASGH